MPTKQEKEVDETNLLEQQELPVLEFEDAMIAAGGFGKVLPFSDIL